MTWIRGQVGTILTAVTLLIAVGIAFGRLDTRQDEMCLQLQGKADKASVTREMDQIHEQLRSIDGKLDALLLRQHERQ
jgi:hypothetical protein